LITPQNQEEKISSGFFDLKMMIQGSYRHVLEHVVKPMIEQNADTGVFSLGNFLQDHGQRGNYDLRGDRPF
jgi:hypothetical protein